MCNCIYPDISGKRLRKMRYITTTILILALSTCGTKEKENLLAGDLYFGFFRLGSYYNVSDSVRANFETYLDTLDLGKADKETIRLINSYKKVKEEKLIYKPFVDILVSSDSVVKLYLDSADYDRIKIYKRRQLQTDNKKIRIKANVRQFDNGYFYCKELVSVEMVDGETLQRQKKLKIEDYN